MTDLISLSKKLLKEESLALICHIRPDGDTLGSALALKCALKKAGKKAEVFCDEAVSEKFFFMEEFKTVKTDFIERAKEFQAIVCMDCGELSRLGTFSGIVSQAKNTYNIDHHVSNTNYAKVNYVCENGANCENVYDLVCEMGIEIDEEIANLLMVGIITDTGCFHHKNTTEKTLKIASELLKFGADLNGIYDKTFVRQSKERAKLFGKTMSKIRFFKNEKIAVASVRLSDFEETGAKQFETEGFIDFVMGIDTVEIGICVMEMEKDKYKISFRSKGPDVNAVAGAFGGGGHVLASGCRISGEYEEVIDRLQFEASKYIED